MVHHGPNARQLREQVLATPLAYYRQWRFIVCCGRCQDGARHLAISLLIPKLPGVTVAQAIARMRCRVRGARCGTRPTYVRVEECGGPEHREDRLQVVLIGGGAVG